MAVKTSRRGFLSFLGAAAASAVLDPEKLLWKPGKLISIPAPVVTPLFDEILFDEISAATLASLNRELRQYHAEHQIGELFRYA